MVDKEINQFIQAAVARRENGEPNFRELAMAMELNQQLVEYYDFLKDEIHAGTITFDNSVTVAVDGKAIRFSDENKLAEWLHEHLG